MERTRPLLRINRPPAPEPIDDADGDAIRACFVNAIVRRRCVTATYNRTTIRMAPHVLYTRHEDLFVDAVVLDRDGQPPKLLKLGAFRLSGLKTVTPTTVPFVRQQAFEPANPLYEGNTVALIDLG